MPDAHETARQHVKQETAQELIDWQCQEAFLVFVSGIPPAECHFVIPEANETTIGDRDAMGVSAEITKHLFGSAERGLAIYDPPQSEQLMDEALKHPGLRPAAEPAIESQLSGSVSLLETFDEFAAKDYAEYVFGKEEARISGAHPVRVVVGEAAGGHDAMHMRMKPKPPIVP